MNDVKKQIEALYRDAVFIHLLQNGLTKIQAELETEKIFSKLKKGWNRK